MDSSSAQSEQTGLTRRRLLCTGAAAAAIGAAQLALPANVTKALAATPPGSGKLSDIKHVVMLMQENRSFAGYLLPYHLDSRTTATGARAWLLLPGQMRRKADRMLATFAAADGSSQMTIRNPKLSRRELLASTPDDRPD